jgi:hypothetical protein
MTEPIDPKKMKIEFAPGVLEQMEQEMGPEELQEFMNMLKEKIEDGTFLTDATPVDMEELEVEDPEAYAQIVESLVELPSKNKLH